MLRVMLGVGGVALIALGVFGGPMLEKSHLAVENFFEPDTLIAGSDAGSAASAEPLVQSNGLVSQQAVISQQLPSATETVVAAVAADGVVSVTGSVAEVHASSKNEPEFLKTGGVAASATDNLVVMPAKEAEVDQIVRTTASGAVDNTLFVLKDRVNLREGPSIDHPIVLQLDSGQELMEFKRDGKWVHVGAYGTSGKIGWVHGTLVGSN